MEKLDGTLLSIGPVGDFRKRSVVVVLEADDVPVAAIAMCDLQAARLFVLADIQAAIAEHTSNLSKDRFDGCDVAGADRLMHDIKRLFVQRREVVHGRFDGADSQATAIGLPLVQRQHLCAQVHNRDTCPGGGVEDRLPATAGGQAQDIQVLNRCRKPAPAVEDVQWPLQLLVGGHPCKAAASADQAIPCCLVVTQVVPLGRRHGGFRRLSRWVWSWPEHR